MIADEWGSVFAANMQDEAFREAFYKAEREYDDAHCPCGTTRWVDDENWSPEFRADKRRPGGPGRLPCGFCNHGGWERARPDGRPVVIAFLRRWRDRRRREADCLVLQALRDGRPHHVYADLHSSTQLRTSRLYPALTRLVERGQVEAGWDPQPSARRWYRLAAAPALSPAQPRGPLVIDSYRLHSSRGRHRARTLRRRRPARIVSAVIGATLIAGIGAATTTSTPPATAITVAAAPAPALPTLPMTEAERVYLVELAEAGIPLAGTDADTAVVIAREHVAHGHLVGMREAIRNDFRDRFPALTPDQVETAKTAVEHHFLAVTGRKQ